MTEISRNNFLPEWCERCNKQGYYFPENHKSPCLVIHQKCGCKFLSAWCEACQMGFTLPIENSHQGKSWSCPNCHSEYSISNYVFQHPISLFTDDELPEDFSVHNVRPQLFPCFRPIHMDSKTKLVWNRVLLVCLGFIILMIINFFPISELWKSNLMKAEGTVIGYDCSDDCTNHYAVVKFSDINGQIHNAYNPDEKLSGEVSVHYRIVKYPWQDNYSVDVQQDPGFINFINLILFILALIFIVSGFSGYMFGIPKEKFKLKLK